MVEGRGVTFQQYGANSPHCSSLTVYYYYLCLCCLVQTTLLVCRLLFSPRFRLSDGKASSFLSLFDAVALFVSDEEDVLDH